MTRRWWIAGFLGITGLALAAELLASWDADPDTVPWTELIVRYVPGEVTYVAVVALVAWLPVHFWRRYRGKDRQGGSGSG